jgi:biotin carboxyl carrier protein
MVGVKKSLIKVLLLLMLHWWGCSLFLPTQSLDFLAERDDQEILAAQRYVKIPIGLANNKIHYLTLARGEPLYKLPSQIAQRRVELGLAPTIAVDQQDDFFQKFPWQMVNEVFIPSPMSACIVSSSVQVGQQIAANEEVCIIEAMKMQCSVRSPVTGTINTIVIQKGGIVSHDSPLMSIVNCQDIDQSRIQENQDFLMALFPWETQPIEPIFPIDPMPPLEDNSSSKVLPSDEPPSEVIGTDTPDNTEANQPAELGDNIYPAPLFSFVENNLGLLDTISSSAFKRMDKIKEIEGDIDTSKAVQTKFPESNEDQFLDVGHDLSLQKMRAKKDKNPMLQEKLILSDTNEYAPHKIKRTSSISLTGMKFLCGFIFLCQLIFMSKSISNARQKQSPLSKIRYLRPADLTKLTFMQNRPAQNRNRVRLRGKELA